MSDMDTIMLGPAVITLLIFLWCVMVMIWRAPKHFLAMIGSCWTLLAILYFTGLMA